jgi:hypothetical protein
MPRREKEPDVTTTEPQTEAPAEAAAATEEKAPPAPKPDKPLGPMTTRTGAEALVIKAPKGQRVFTAGGDKGQKIKELLTTKPEMPRKEIAALVGCSQSRVAEVARVLGISKSREESAATNGEAAAAEATPATKTA